MSYSQGLSYKYRMDPHQHEDRIVNHPSNPFKVIRQSVKSQGNFQILNPERSLLSDTSNLHSTYNLPA
jgi:hypothetical protein